MRVLQSCLCKIWGERDGICEVFCRREDSIGDGLLFGAVPGGTDSSAGRADNDDHHADLQHFDGILVPFLQQKMPFRIEYLENSDQSFMHLV
jgi:hypothetical protein